MIQTRVGKCSKISLESPPFCAATPVLREICHPEHFLHHQCSMWVYVLHVSWLIGKKGREKETNCDGSEKNYMIINESFENGIKVSPSKRNISDNEKLRVKFLGNDFVFCSNFDTHFCILFSFFIIECGIFKIIFV